MNPFPGPNSVIVLDNCSTHKSDALREAVEASGVSTPASILSQTSDMIVGCLLIFLPPYSPDFNLIEESFSCCKFTLISSYFLSHTLPAVKKWLRRHWRDLQNSQFPEQDLREACFMAVNGENARGWCRHSGYL